MLLRCGYAWDVAGLTRQSSVAIVMLAFLHAVVIMLYSAREEGALAGTTQYAMNCIAWRLLLMLLPKPSRRVWSPLIHVFALQTF